MAREHDRFEELAVGHVLGGLPASAASEFRSHLTGCRDCRARVAELRDIASDLAAAEREERDAARVKTETARRVDEDQEDVTAWAVPSRTIGLALGAVALILMGLAFWNFHLRDQAAVMAQVTETRESILEGLADGVLVPTETAPEVSGVVVRGETDVSLTLTGLPAPGQGQRLVVWLLGDTPQDHRWRGYGPGEVPTGRLAWRTPHEGAERLVVTLEAEPVGDEPSGRELVNATLSPDATP